MNNINNINNTTHVKITISPDKDANALFETLKRLGVTEATLEGNIIFGVVSNNLVIPLKTIDGVIDVIGEKNPPSSKNLPSPVPKVTSWNYPTKI